MWTISLLPELHAFIKGVSPPIVVEFTSIFYSVFILPSLSLNSNPERPTSNKILTAVKLPAIEAKCSGILLNLSWWFKFGFFARIRVMSSALSLLLSLSIPPSGKEHANESADILVSVTGSSTGYSDYNMFFTSVSLYFFILGFITCAAFLTSSLLF